MYGSPECLNSGPSHLSTEGRLRPSSKDAKTQRIESGDENITSYQGSDVKEQLEVDISSKFEDQHSEHLLKLEQEDRPDSQEKLPTSKHVSSSVSKEHQYSPSVSLDHDKQVKTRETSEAEEAVKSNIISSKSHSAAVDLETSPYPSHSDHSGSPDSAVLSSKKEAPFKDVKASSATVDDYHDDFESSVYSSPREEHHSYKPASDISVSPTEIKGQKKNSTSGATPYDSVDEEIAEELSHQSEMSDSNHQSVRVLDLHDQTADSKQDGKDIVNSSHSPPVSPLQTPLTPHIDEMSSFDIGDRVLVGGVQPGTLRFKGPTSFANGYWAGVELDKSEGSNNGTYDGVVYFECHESHGIFAPPDKITHLPEKFEIYTDTTEDEDSFFDDLPGKGGDERKTDGDKTQKEGNLKSQNKQTSHEVSGSGEKKVADESVSKTGSQLSSKFYRESKYSISNGNTGDIILDFEDAPTTLLITDMDRIGSGKQSQKDITSLNEREDVDSQHQLTHADQKEQKDLLDTFADKLVNNFVNDTLKQFAKIKKAKEQKIEAANQMNGDLFGEDAKEEKWFSSVEQKDGLPFFLPAEKEELSSPELCNRPVSVYF